MERRRRERPSFREQKADIQVDRLALEGDGIGRLSGPGEDSGKVAFVGYSLPGEKIEGRLVVQKKNLSRWLPIKISVPSFSRVTPPCAYHFKPGQTTPWCGGCNWQQMNVKDQGAAKRNLLVESLERIGGFQNPPVSNILSSPSEWRYRNKVQVPFGVQGRDLVAGFFAPESHRIVEFDDCLVQSELSVQLVLFIKKLAREWNWHPYDEDRHRGWLRHALVRTNRAGQALVALVVTTPNFKDQRKFIELIRKNFPTVVGVHLNLQPARTNVILGRHWISLGGADYLEEKILGLRVAYSPGAFFQVNTGAAERLYEEAIRLLDPKPDSVVADLYCGVGALTMAIAKKARRVIGVEMVYSAIRDAEYNAKLNGIRNVDYVTAAVEDVFSPRGSRVMEELSGRRLSVVVDPPRSGCAPQALQAIVRLRPERIVYISCHPATLARDLKILSSDYNLAGVTPVDLFPQTAHIEAVARLDRR